MKIQRIGMVGYGEVGKIVSAGLQSHVDHVSAWDITFDAEATAVRPRDMALAYAAPTPPRWPKPCAAGAWTPRQWPPRSVWKTT